MLSSPSTIVLDRRRRHRYCLQPDITLEFFVSDQHKTPLGVGKLLNLSMDGMACKVPLSTSQTLHRQGEIVVSLKVGEPSSELWIPCQIVNTMEGADENNFIVGVEFNWPKEDNNKSLLYEVIQRREK